MRYLKLAKKYDPNNKTININIGNLCVYEKRYSEAISFYEESLKTDYQNLSTLRSFMNCLALVKDYTRLEQVCKTILILDKTNTKALALLMRALKKNNKFDQLEKIVTKVQKKLIKINDNYSEEFVSQSSFLKLTNKINEKLLEVRNNIKIQDQEEIINNEEFDGPVNGEKFDFNPKNEFSVDQDPILYLKLVQKDPKNFDALVSLGKIYYIKQQYELSEEYFYKAQDVNSTNKKSLIHERLADIYEKFYNDYEKAINFYNICLEEKHNDYIFVKIGICYEKLKDYENAIKYFKKSIEEFDYIWGYYYIENLLLKAIDPNSPETVKGKKYLEQAYEKNQVPQYFEISKRYCEELVKESDRDLVDKGIEFLKSLLEMYPEKVEVYYLLSKAYDKLGRINECISVLEKANKLRDFFLNPDYLFTLGIAYEKNKETKNAIEIFKSILQKNKEHIQSLTHLGRILLNMKEPKRAMKYFNFALTLDDNNALANFGVGKILQEDKEGTKEEIEKNLTDALKHYDKVIKMNDQHYKYYY